jgi:hypothetical protein
MTIKRPVSIEMLRSMIDYNPETGEMCWKERSGRARGRAQAGSVIGTPRDKYRYVGILGNKIGTHRIAFALANGHWPQPMCDHANGDPADNRACNLREATALQNAHNTRGNKRSYSGTKGVAWHPVNKRWTTRVTFKGRRHSFGCYETIEEAAQAVRAGRERLHGEYARH